jgi:hypothetical protein
MLTDIDPAFIDILKAKGVKLYSRHESGFTVEFFISGHAPLPDSWLPIVGRVADPEVCRCGHSLHVEHSEAGCLRGCPLAVCAPHDNEVPDDAP